MNRLPDNIVIYAGGPYVFHVKSGLPCLTVNGRTFALTCPPLRAVSLYRRPGRGKGGSASALFPGPEDFRLCPAYIER